MTDYHHLINHKAHGLIYGRKSMSIVNQVTHIYFHFFDALNDAFEVQYLSASYLHLMITDTDRAMKLRFFFQRGNMPWMVNSSPRGGVRMGGGAGLEAS